VPVTGFRILLQFLELLAQARANVGGPTAGQAAWNLLFSASPVVVAERNFTAQPAYL